MAPAADFDTFSMIFEFYLQTFEFNSARTLAYFNHSGIFYTETKTLFGAFAVGDYGPNASTRTGPKNLPKYLEQNGYIHYDYGGNAGGTEVAMMILDHWLYTQNRTALGVSTPQYGLCSTKRWAESPRVAVQFAP